MGFKSISTTDTVYRVGSIYKKGSKRGWFGRDNWKPRYAILTSNCLYYYTERGGRLKGVIDLSHCYLHDIEIMPTDCLKTGNDRSTIWRIAIRTPERRFIMAALSQLEMNAWVDAIESAILNSGRSSIGSSIDTRLSSFEHYTELKSIPLSQRKQSLTAILSSRGSTIA